MNFYRVVVFKASDADPKTNLSYHATQSDAHAVAKTHGTNDWQTSVVELIEVPSDKDGVLKLLNGFTYESFSVRRNWELTTRGGLKEVPLED